MSTAFRGNEEKITKGHNRLSVTATLIFHQSHTPHTPHTTVSYSLFDALHSASNFGRATLQSQTQQRCRSMSQVRISTSMKRNRSKLSANCEREKKPNKNRGTHTCTNTQYALEHNQRRIIYMTVRVLWPPTRLLNGCHK